MAGVEQIAECNPARRPLEMYARTCAQGHIVKFAIVVVAIQNLPLQVRSIRGGLVNLGVNVAIGHENIRPSIVIEVEEPDSPPNKFRISSDPRSKGIVVKGAVAAIAIEGAGVGVEVRLNDIEESVAIVVSGSDSHATLFAAVFAEANTRQAAHLGEGAVAVVMKEERSGGIVGYVDIRPTIVVVVEDQRREPEVAIGGH